MLFPPTLQLTIQKHFKIQFSAQMRYVVIHVHLSHQAHLNRLISNQKGSSPPPKKAFELHFLVKQHFKDVKHLIVFHDVCQIHKIVASCRHPFLIFASPWSSDGALSLLPGENPCPEIFSTGMNHHMAPLNSFELPCSNSVLISIRKLLGSCEKLPAAIVLLFTTWHVLTAIACHAVYTEEPGGWIICGDIKWK